jgi:hypothetical protein
MSQKKVVSRNIAIGLAAALIVVIVAFSGILYYYYNMNLTENKTSSAPSIINVGLGAADDGIFPTYQPNLHILGYIVNTGSDTAYNVKLHVVASYTNGASAIDTYLTVGSGILQGKDSYHLDTTVPYSSSMTGQISAQIATLTPIWTANP